MKKKVSELKELVEDLGISTRGFLEIADFVKAIVEAQQHQEKNKRRGSI